MSDKNPMKSIKEFISKVGVSFTNTKEAMQSCGPAFIVYTVALFLLMGFFTLIIFIAFNKGYEHEVVPDVVGKNIYQAELIFTGKGILSTPSDALCRYSGTCRTGYFSES